ncbi:MAG: exodeoxyribonuclease VII large subunit [Betaproteobacteria bacterium]|nr:exodeoxyribonuclease VII large subunit [Betaproteobacteria bacterium]
MPVQSPDLFSTPDNDFGEGTRPPVAAPLTVSEVNRRAKRLIEVHFELIWVRGELSNVTRAASGHWYFSLKDDAAQVRCVMFRNRAALVGFVPENGMQVEVRALPSMYEARGEFQLGVETLRRAGLGALFERFERLKATLRAEGLFEEARKRALPTFPKRIGIVTSLAAAALQDVLTTLRRRAPMIGVVIYPSAVQGAAAAAELAAALDQARMRNEVDVLIVCRGGGSIEDLWSFNEEIVARSMARAMAETDIVVISGVGHESDFTIADFVADVRAPTPTAAAELVSPDRAELRAAVLAAHVALARAQARAMEQRMQALDAARLRLIPPGERIRRESLRLQWIAGRMRHAMAVRHAAALAATRDVEARLRATAAPIGTWRARLDGMEARLQLAARHLHARAAQRHAAARVALGHLDPRLVLSRGYAIVEHGGAIVRNASSLQSGDAISVRVATGSLDAAVIRTRDDAQSA